MLRYQPCAATATIVKTLLIALVQAAFDKYLRVGVLTHSLFRVPEGADSPGSCRPAPEEEDASVPAKARKGAKVRRHTTRAHFTAPPSPEEEERGQVTMEGRPLAP